MSEVEPRWPKGLSLIHTAFAEFSPENPPSPLTGLYDEAYTVKVPKKTKAVHAAIKAMELSFGDTTSEPYKPSTVACILFEIRETKLAGGKYTFHIGAILQDGLKSDPTGLWNARFTIEFMCFG